MPRGGIRKPNNPAPVSGPGALSRRTDGGPADKKQPVRYISGLGYGQGQEMMNIQQSAPMAASQPPASISNSQAGQQAQAAPVQITPIGAPSTRPSEPVTAGADAGAGPGTAALGLSFNNVPQRGELAAALEPLLQFDTTGKVQTLYNIAVRSGW